jgi:hypothetical protein
MLSTVVKYIKNTLKSEGILVDGGRVPNMAVPILKAEYIPRVWLETM